MAHTRPIPCQFDKWNCQMFINIKKYKIVRKDHLRIIFFLMAIQDLCFKQFTSMQDLETNNYKNPRIKTLLTLPVPSILKYLFKVKNDNFLFSHFFVVPQNDFIILRLQKRSVNIKNLSFPPLIPDWYNKVKIVLLCHFSFLNSTDT